jgi:hypothetical protein
VAESLLQRRGAVVHALYEPIRQQAVRAAHRLASHCRGQLAQPKLEIMLPRARHRRAKTEKAEGLWIGTRDPQIA